MSKSPLLYREGDVVKLTGVVKYEVEQGEDKVHVRVNGSHTSAIINREHVSLERRAWSPGEKVQHVSGAAFGEVVAVHGGWVWIQAGDDSGDLRGMLTYQANELVEVPEEETPLEKETPALVEVAKRYPVVDL